MLEKEFIKILLTLLIGVIGFLIAKKLKFPAPAMIGSMLGVGVFNAIFEVAFMPSTLKTFTQGIAGMFIGLRMSKDDLKSARKLAKPILLLCFIFTINTFITGIIISFLCNIDLMTCLLSCIAGGVTDVSLISMDLGANTSVVALLQTTRLVSTLLIFPAWVTFFTKNESLDDIENSSLVTKQIKKHNVVIDNVISIVAAFILGYLGKLTGTPAGSLIVSMLGTMVIHWYFPIFRSDKIVKTISQLFAGSIVGSTINHETIINLPSLIIPVCILILSYWIINILYGKICAKKGTLDLRTAMFAACPAGASDMALIASDLGADMTKVSLIQVLRLVYSVSVMPQLVMLFMNVIS